MVIYAQQHIIYGALSFLYRYFQL